MLRDDERFSDTDEGSSSQNEMCSKNGKDSEPSCSKKPRKGRYSKNRQDSVPSCSKKSLVVSKIVDLETRRQHINEKERDRRHLITKTFTELNDVLPLPPKSSKVKILKKAAILIEKGTLLVKAIEKSRREVKLLEKKFEAYNEAKDRGDVNSCRNILEDIDQLGILNTVSDCEDKDGLENTDSVSKMEMD